MIPAASSLVRRVVLRPVSQVECLPELFPRVVAAISIY